MEIGLVGHSADAALCISCLTICMLEIRSVMARYVLLDMLGDCTYNTNYASEHFLVIEFLPIFLRVDCFRHI